MSRPLHICFLCSEYPPAPHGGIGTFTQMLGRQLVARGNRVTAVGMYPDQHAGPDLDDQGVRVIRLSRKGLPLARLITNRGKLLKALQELNAKDPIDVLEGGELELSAIGRSAPGIKLLRMHGGPSFFQAGSRIQKAKERWAFHVADELCAVSRAVGEGTRELLGLGARHIEVIHNPVDTSQFTPAPSGGEEDGLIVFTGTVSERKGIRQLIQAMPRIVAEVAHARLEVYGGESIDPPPPVSFADQLKTSLPANVAAQVDFKGRVPRNMLPAAIQRASVCVYPSHMEAMPIGWIEGMASGKAVVASETGPGLELIDDGLTGLLCNPHDPESIASALIQVLKDRELRARLGANARRVAEERWDLHRIAQRNEEYYERLVSDYRRRKG
jgi:glycosyltransferase involved in cell wall biosynthesis